LKLQSSDIQHSGELNWPEVLQRRIGVDKAKLRRVLSKAHDVDLNPGIGEIAMESTNVLKMSIEPFPWQFDLKCVV
jgi:hypothetical protein